MTVEGMRTATSGYAGDITVQEAWKMLQEQQNATLIDVRTDAEWAYVGLPDLSSMGKRVQTISWVRFPDMSPNPDFLEAVRNSQPDTSAPLLFLCRSGVRSIAAAKSATEAGYTQCYNILAGFEGDLDEHRHRGVVGGWKVENLDWVQD